MGVGITRFAPAPTGFLHLGHIVNALSVWGEARARSARELIRIEDHDRQRSRPEFEAAIFEDLEWLGFLAPEVPIRQSPGGGTHTTTPRALRARGPRHP